ncbi:MAG: leucine-rich repeat protein, partial [Lachnospiraceae bacterium]|nr:leucine-rich repeat protein [Lachnospiraceae bacterium]
IGGDYADSYKIKINNLAEGSKVTYKSSNPAAAKVTTSGVIKPVAVGKADVTVTIKQSGKTYTGTIAVTVRNPYVKITTAPTTMTVGETAKLVANVYGLKKTTVTWTVSDKTIATINSETRELTAKKAGTVKVTFSASFKENGKDTTSKKTNAVTITIVDPPKEEEELPEDEVFEYDVENGQAVITGVYDYSVTSLVIPSTIGKYKVTAIGDGAFEGLADMKSVRIPATIKTIGDNAFSMCSELKTVALPTALTSLGESAFEGCEALTSITIPDSITVIPAGAFSGCSALKTITFGKAVKEIGEEAFYECTSLTSLTIPSTVTLIDADAFGGCEALSSLTFKAGLKTLEDYAFEGCVKLTQVTLPSTLNYLGSGAFDGCEALKSATVPSSVEDMGGGVFDNCSESFKMKVKKNSVAWEYAEDYEIPYSTY